MNYIKSIISKNKSRFIDRKYNLDLSYITPRLITMAFPGSGFYGLIRNNINDVSNFLNERHGKNYLVINLSGRKYDNSKFNNNVIEHILIDHHAPSLSALFEICNEIHEYLTMDISNVVVINCKGGKGRAGTIICCYLLYTGRFNNPDEAFTYYSLKRFYKGEGVTQPSQRRYVNYFYNLLTKNKRFFPYRIKISSIILDNFDKSDRNGQYISPYCDFYNNNSNKINITTKENYFTQKTFLVMNNKVCITDKNFSYYVAGDVSIKISINDMFFVKKMGKISFNTAFLEEDQNEIVFHANEVDPDNLSKKKKVPKEYKIILKIEKLCDCDNTKAPISLCYECKNFLEKNKISLVWKKMIELTNNYRPLDKFDQSSMEKVKNILFGDIDIDDIDYVLKNGNRINSPTKLSNIIPKENDEAIKEEKEKNQENGNMEKEEEEKIDDNEEESDNSYDESSEEEENEDDDNAKNNRRKKKKNLNDSFENECDIF